jgi:thioesterase domain-containing protein/acyl carrier protein
VLSIDKIGVQDNFFELGGHSLRAVTVCVLIQKELGKMLPLATLFQAPTVEGIARTLRGESRLAESSPMVMIQQGGDRPPLFCLPGAGGHCINYRAMAALMNPAQPVYGFNLRGLDGMDRPHTRVEDMAREFLNYVRQAQPHGPYHFIGYSFGGWVAIEMARLLLQEHEITATLILVDSWGKDYPKVLSPIRRIGVHIDNIMKLDMPHKIEYSLARARNARNKIGDLLRRARKRMVHQTQTSIDVIEDVNEATWKAMAGYVPQRYPGSAVLLRAAITPEWPGSSFEDPLNGWGGVFEQGLDVVNFHCRHLEMFHQPTVAVLTRHVESLLHHNTPQPAHR